MKHFITLVFILSAVYCSVAALTPEQKQKHEQYQNECIGEVGITLDAVKKARQGTIEDEAKESKYLLCMFKKMKFLKDDNTFDTERMEKFVPEDMDHKKAIDLIKDCTSKGGDTPEAKSLAAFKCFTPHISFD